MKGKEAKCMNINEVKLDIDGCNDIIITVDNAQFMNFYTSLFERICKPCTISTRYNSRDISIGYIKMTFRKDKDFISALKSLSECDSISCLL